MRLHRQLQHLADRRTVLAEIEDPELQDAAYMDVLAAEQELRAEIRRARQEAGIATISLAEAEDMRRTTLTGV